MLVEKDLNWTGIPTAMDELKWPEIIHSTVRGELWLLVLGRHRETKEERLFSVTFDGPKAFSAVDELMFVTTTGGGISPNFLNVTDASGELQRAKADPTDLPLRHYLMLGGHLQWQVLCDAEPVVESYENEQKAFAAAMRAEKLQ